MATSKSQRIGIWVIAVVLTIGTIGSFFIMVLENDNLKIDQENAQKSYQEELKKYVEAQKEAQKANRPLEGFEAKPFDKGSISKLSVDVLKDGDGPVVQADSTINANYFGWTSDGSIFDSTNKNGTLTPIDFSLSQVIEGWQEGLTGVKVGSTVQLAIPAEKAYGSQDDGSGRPVGPLMFIVQVNALK